MRLLLFFFVTPPPLFPLRESSSSTRSLSLSLSLSLLVCVYTRVLCRKRARKRERKPNATTPFFITKLFENLEKKKKKKKKKRRRRHLMTTFMTTTSLSNRGQFLRQFLGKKKKGPNERRRASGGRTTRGRVEIRARKQGGSGTRPYTLRSGDTLESIASKRKLNVETLRNMNKKVGSNPKIGETILIPSGALSARDLEIINGIAKINAPRTYIPRKGETIGDVITARKIDFAEVQKLNPDVKLGTFSGKESLKLPPGKYTVREREMLQGCGILPQDAVSIKLPGAESARNILVATVLVGAYSMYFAACRRYHKYGTKLFGNDREEDEDY